MTQTRTTEIESRTTADAECAECDTLHHAAHHAYYHASDREDYYRAEDRVIHHRASHRGAK